MKKIIEQKILQKMFMLKKSGEIFQTKNINKNISEKFLDDFLFIFFFSFCKNNYTKKNLHNFMKKNQVVFIKKNS